MRWNWRCRTAEIETPYYARPEGSVSKLNTWRDGFRILGTILKLYRSEKPLRFFTGDRHFSDAGFDRPRDPRIHHLS